MFSFPVKLSKNVTGVPGMLLILHNDNFPCIRHHNLDLNARAAR